VRRSGFRHRHVLDAGHVVVPVNRDLTSSADGVVRRSKEDVEDARIACMGPGRFIMLGPLIPHRSWAGDRVFGTHTLSDATRAVAYGIFAECSSEFGGNHDG
jgi:hypothetical protein